MMIKFRNFFFIILGILSILKTAKVMFTRCSIWWFLNNQNYALILALLPDFPVLRLK